MLHHISGAQRGYTIQYYMAPASTFIRQKQNQVLSLLYILSVHFNSSEHNYTALLVFLYIGKNYCYTAGIKHALATFYNGVFLRVTLPDEHTTGSRIRTGLQCGGQIARPHRPIISRLTHLSAPTADSPMIYFRFTMVIINSVVDNYWPVVSGEIHPVYFYIIYCFL